MMTLCIEITIIITFKTFSSPPILREIVLILFRMLKDPNGRNQAQPESTCSTVVLFWPGVVSFGVLVRENQRVLEKPSRMSTTRVFYVTMKD